jgi:hypothetical protein
MYDNYIDRNKQMPRIRFRGLILYFTGDARTKDIVPFKASS